MAHEQNQKKETDCAKHLRLPQFAGLIIAFGYKIMKEEMTRPEKGLIWSACVFAIIAALMVILPYIVTHAFARRSGNHELGGAAFAMTYGVIMMAFGAFSWISSLIMLIVNVTPIAVH